MVTVVATQELKAFDFLLQFKAAPYQDDIHGIRFISARPVFGNCCYTWDSSHLCVGAFFFVGTRLCDDLFCFSCDV